MGRGKPGPDGDFDRRRDGVRMEFGEDVMGPFAIGYGGDLGMGVFVAVKEG